MWRSRQAARTVPWLCRPGWRPSRPDRATGRLARQRPAGARLRAPGPAAGAFRRTSSGRMPAPGCPAIHPPCCPATASSPSRGAGRETSRTVRESSERRSRPGPATVAACPGCCGGRCGPTVRRTAMSLTGAQAAGSVRARRRSLHDGLPERGNKRAPWAAVPGADRASMRAGLGRDTGSFARTAGGLQAPAGARHHARPDQAPADQAPEGRMRSREHALARSRRPHRSAGAADHARAGDPPERPGPARPPGAAPAGGGHAPTRRHRRAVTGGRFQDGLSLVRIDGPGDEGGRSRASPGSGPGAPRRPPGRLPAATGRPYSWACSQRAGTGVNLCSGTSPCRPVASTR